jgi:hypothetical protein
MVAGDHGFKRVEIGPTAVVLLFHADGIPNVYKVQVYVAFGFFSGLADTW